MTTKYVDKTVKEKRGGDITFTLTRDLLMIHSDTISCQFPRESMVSIMDDGGTHGILRLMDSASLQTAMTLFIKYEDGVPLALFLDKHLGR